LGATFSVHGGIRNKSACFLVSVARNTLHCVACKFDTGLSISVLRNEQLFTKIWGLKTDQVSKSLNFEILQTRHLEKEQTILLA
jgi:hypothetical protein